jgi:putative SOS response-associated peptidase YedK
MCGRYTLIANAEAIRVLFKVAGFDERLVLPRYNIAPTQPIVVVRQALSGRGRELVPMRWGLIPAWAKDPADFPLLIMARADGLADKPAFRNAFQRRRCLIPASGFYEWQGRGKGRKQPFAIRPGSAELVAFAGLWETWVGNDGSEIDTAAIVTTDCNDFLRPIHDRMPAVLDSEDFDAWLSPHADPEEAHSLLRPAPEDLFACIPVSTRVNSVANDGPGLWEEAPHDWPDRQPQQGSLF